MIVVWLKLLHVTALSIWAGGILLMPLLLGRREAAGDGATLHRLHAFSRFAYIVVISPAAFVAIGSGIGLIFAREVYTAWFAAKLLLVGGLVALHVWVGLLVLSVFDEGGRFARWRVAASVVVLSALITAIFWVVLAKPPIALAGWVADLARPGGLGALAEPLIRRLTP
ncbi:CopD family protein [Aureimonas pseudogalii]|uniref:Protoporphyrinogen IX oxidase n=1 Tax=Aureimonas pseudogalii TaxID=1744844 RepID=A0A7W6H4M1_9HYPH|nr:CopD family protein [Aureimonas pseudogalii]MBB3997294.1 putative membrane protein [Aureimonas pseudogalii]